MPERSSAARPPPFLVGRHTVVTRTAVVKATTLSARSDLAVAREAFHARKAGIPDPVQKRRTWETRPGSARDLELCECLRYPCDQIVILGLCDGDNIPVPQKHALLPQNRIDVRRCCDLGAGSANRLEVAIRLARQR